MLSPAFLFGNYVIRVLRHFQRGIAAKENLPMDDEVAALVFGLRRAQSAVAGPPTFQQARDTLSQAFKTLSRLSVHCPVNCTTLPNFRRGCYSDPLSDSIFCPDHQNGVSRMAHYIISDAAKHPASDPRAAMGRQSNETVRGFTSSV